MVTDERKNFLKSIFTPQPLPRIPLSDVKKTLEEFHLLGAWEERIKFFDQMLLKDKFILFQHLDTLDQAYLLMYSSIDNSDILVLFNSLGAGERFVLQRALHKKDVL